jgi:4'-phosphopantetheinyl transferase
MPTDPKGTTERPAWPGCTNLQKVSLHQTQLWLTFPNEIDDARLLARYREILSAEERTQQGRFVFEKDRHRYLVTRVLIRTVLSHYASVMPEDWCFRNNAYGRPEVASPATLHDTVSFNISHTDDLIVCAITGQREIGVDVESLDRRASELDKLANRFFSAQECAELSRVPAAERHERFFHYWTLKEAYIKARGMGLSIPLDQFSFALTGEDAVELSIDRGLKDSSSRWQCWLLKPTPRHLAAVCVARTEFADEKPQATKIVPLVSEQPFPLTLLRQSMPMHR